LAWLGWALIYWRSIGCLLLHFPMRSRLGSQLARHRRNCAHHHQTSLAKTKKKTKGGKKEKGGYHPSAGSAGASVSCSLRSLVFCQHRTTLHKIGEDLGPSTTRPLWKRGDAGESAEIKSSFGSSDAVLVSFRMGNQGKPRRRDRGRIGGLQAWGLPEVRGWRRGHL
jgi:hypothetical protein